jgi:hypothetical protein
MNQPAMMHLSILISLHTFFKLRDVELYKVQNIEFSYNLYLYIYIFKF